MNDETYNDTDRSSPCGESNCGSQPKQDDLLSCIPMPQPCYEILRKLRAPVIRLSYRMDMQMIPNVDAAISAGQNAGGKGSGDGNTADGNTANADTEGGNSASGGALDDSDAKDSQFCQCGNGCMCSQTTEAGSITVRLFDLVLICMGMMMIGCVTSCCAHTGKPKCCRADCRKSKC